MLGDDVSSETELVLNSLSYPILTSGARGDGVSSETKLILDNYSCSHSYPNQPL